MVTSPDWLTVFVDAITAHIHSYGLLSPLGCHVHYVEDVWEITIFASRIEIVGGSHDGRCCNPPFAVDICRLQETFSEIEAVFWQAQPLGLTDEIGAHLSIEGIYDQQRIRLRLTAAAPSQFDTGCRVHINRSQMEVTW